MVWKLVRKASYSAIRSIRLALTGVAQWVGHCPANQKVASSITSQGTCLSSRPGPWLEACKRQPINVSLAHIYFSPSLSPSFPLSLKINKIFKEKMKHKAGFMVPNQKQHQMERRKTVFLWVNCGALLTY